MHKCIVKLLRLRLSMDIVQIWLAVEQAIFKNINMRQESFDYNYIY